MFVFKDEKSSWRRTKGGGTLRLLDYAYMLEDPLLLFQEFFKDMYSILYITRTALGTAVNWNSYLVYTTFSIAIVL